MGGSNQMNPILLRISLENINSTCNFLQASFTAVITDILQSFMARRFSCHSCASVMRFSFEVSEIQCARFTSLCAWALDLVLKVVVLVMVLSCFWHFGCVFLAHWTFFAVRKKILLLSHHNNETLTFQANESPQVGSTSHHSPHVRGGGDMLGGGGGQLLMLTKSV